MQINSYMAYLGYSLYKGLALKAQANSPLNMPNITCLSFTKTSSIVYLDFTEHQKLCEKNYKDVKSKYIKLLKQTYLKYNITIDFVNNNEHFYIIKNESGVLYNSYIITLLIRFLYSNAYLNYPIVILNFYKLSKDIILSLYLTSLYTHNGYQSYFGITHEERPLIYYNFNKENFFTNKNGKMPENGFNAYFRDHNFETINNNEFFNFISMIKSLQYKKAYNYYLNLTKN